MDVELPYADSLLPAQGHRRQRAAHWDRLYRDHGHHQGCRPRLFDACRGLVARDARVLHVGCGRGCLLAALAPGRGLGIDLSSEAIAQGRTLHPEIQLVHSAVEDAALANSFDAIICSRLFEELWDPLAALVRLRQSCHPATRLIIEHRRPWRSTPSASRFSRREVANALAIAGFTCVGRFGDLIVAEPTQHAPAVPVSMSVIVPARNERGTIADLCARIPEVAGGTEIVIVEGGSSDGTWEEIQRCRDAFPQRRIVILRQAGRGKADAVRSGFDAASGEVLVILDADLGVVPEDLVHFHAAIAGGFADLANGSRLVHAIPPASMPFCNRLANRAFAAGLSLTCRQRIGDSLCGTKALRRSLWHRIAALDPLRGEDPFGDFELLIGAARVGARIRDVPVRYHARSYGVTNIQRWRHGWQLLRILIRAALSRRC